MYKDDEKVLTISGLSYNLSDFEGFPSKLAWLDVSFVENTFANFIVTEINAQKLNAEDKDNAAPLYSIKVNNDEKSLGEELVVSRFIAGDVLKFNAKCYLTIYAPDNKPCETIAGVTMKDVTDFSTEHVIKLNKLGTYRIVGQVTDGVRKVSVNRQVNVKDSVAPVITLTDVKETAYTGSIRIAKYKVEDNDSSVFVSISVQCPDMSVISITNDTFVARTKGVYTVMFFATDEAGNVGFASYEVVVK